MTGSPEQDRRAYMHRLISLVMLKDFMQYLDAAVDVCPFTIFFVP